MRCTVREGGSVDQQRFDHLARSLSRRLPRRRSLVLASLMSAGFGLGGRVSAPDEIAAKGKKGKHKKRKGKHKKDICIPCELGFEGCCNPTAGEACAQFDGCCNTLTGNTVCDGKWCCSANERCCPGHGCISRTACCDDTIECPSDPSGCCKANEQCCPGTGCQPLSVQCCASDEFNCAGLRCCPANTTCTHGLYDGQPRAKCCGQPRAGFSMTPCDGECCEHDEDIICCAGRQNPCRFAGAGC